MKRNYLILLIFLFLFATCSKTDKIVATIGKDRNITVPEFISFYNQRNKQNIQNASYDKLKENLDQMIEDEIKIKAAYEMGLDQDSTLKQSVEEFQRKTMLELLYQIQIVEQVVNESLIRDYYNKSSKEADIQDLVISVNRSATPEDKEKKKEKAEMILEELKAGKDFQHLANQYTQDPQIYITEKTISYVRINDPFQTEVFSLQPGQTSEIIQDYQGFHIVHIKKFNLKDIAPYKQKRDEIIYQLSNQLRPKIQQKASQYLTHLVQEAHITWNEKALNEVYSHVDNIEDNDQEIGIVHDSLMNVSADVKKLELLDLRGKSITVDNIINKLSQFNPQILFPCTDPERLKKNIVNLFQGDLLTQAALRLHLDTHKEVREEIKSFKERSLIRMLNQQDIFKAKEPDDEQIYNYYINNKDKKYSHLGNPSFDAVKSKVKRDFRRELSEKKKKEWLTEKINEYNVTVFDNVLREIVHEEKA